jgi:hypothetical protein
MMDWSALLPLGIIVGALVALYFARRYLDEKGKDDE